MKKIIFILFSLLSINHIVAQHKIEKGKYISEDRLTYITILDENKFSYIEYYKWSPYTIEEDRKKGKMKNEVCGVVGYVANRQGEGIYKIENNQLKLEFTNEKEIKSNVDKEKSYKYFDLTKLLKI